MRAAAARLVATATLALATSAVTAQDLRNWFDDPFFQVTHAVAGCPEPAGPRVSEALRQAQSHRRAEKGTTCWLARESDCERSSAYAYDRDIADAVRAAFAAAPALAASSLWVTVQGRVVYVEGCVAAASDATAIEARVRALPHVQQAIAIVTTLPTKRPPYRVLAVP